MKRATKPKKDSLIRLELSESMPNGRLTCKHFQHLTTTWTGRILELGPKNIICSCSNIQIYTHFDIRICSFYPKNIKLIYLCS